MENAFTPVDYLKVGSRRYSLVDITDQTGDITEEIRTFYKEQYENFVKGQIDVTASNLSTEWNTQINHLRRVANPSEVRLPDNLRNKPTFYYSSVGEWLQLRTFIYHPTKMITTADVISGHFKGDSEEDQWNNMLDKHPALNENYDEKDTQLSLIFEQNVITIPIIIGYAEKRGRLLIIDNNTFHSFTDGQVCLGNGSARQYWGLQEPHFSETMSAINMFSLANSYCGNSTSYYIGELIQKMNILDVSPFLNDDNNTRRGIWRIG